VSWQQDNIIKALEEIRKAKVRNFIQSIEILVALRDINLKDPSIRFNLEVKMPHPIKKAIKIGIFASGDLATRSEAEGLTVLNKDQLEQTAKDVKAAKKLADGHDFFLAERQFMPLVGRYYGKILGPRGKMPKPVAPNSNVQTLKEDYARTIRLRLRENPCVNSRVGTLDNSDDELVQNITVALNTIQGRLPRGADQIRHIHVKSTMSPAVLLK
jgi:large subunit ribosomal protein L1